MRAQLRTLNRVIKGRIAAAIDDIALKSALTLFLDKNDFTNLSSFRFLAAESSVLPPETYELTFRPSSSRIPHTAVCIGPHYIVQTRFIHRRMGLYELSNRAREVLRICCELPSFPGEFLD